MSYNAFNSEQIAPGRGSETPQPRNQRSEQIRERIIEIIRANPGISSGKLADEYYGAKPKWERSGFQSTLVQLQLEGRVEYRPVNCYVVKE